MKNLEKESILQTSRYYTTLLCVYCERVNGTTDSCTPGLHYSDTWTRPVLERIVFTLFSSNKGTVMGGSPGEELVTQEKRKKGLENEL